MALFALAFGQHHADDHEEESSRLERHVDDGHHHDHDVVDFGAHTGDHGAFGWYADFPVHSEH